MSGSHFIAQTSKFLRTDATAVTLGQGHRKVIEYISPDSYILCAKYLWFSTNGFDVRDKSCWVGGRGGGGEDAAETNWKHKFTPDWGDLINQISARIQAFLFRENNQYRLLHCWKNAFCAILLRLIVYNTRARGM